MPIHVNHHATYQTTQYLNVLTLTIVFCSQMRYKLTIQHEVVGEEGCPLADDQPPWKRGHVKLQLPKIHHGRGNIKKNHFSSYQTSEEGRQVRQQYDSGRERDPEASPTKKNHEPTKIVK
jgi:hypothetical protein